MIKNRDFRRDLLLGRDMRKLKIGIIGFGNVGKKVAKRLIPFGSKMYILEKNKKVNKTYYKVKTLNASNIQPSKCPPLEGTSGGEVPLNISMSTYMSA